MFVHFDLTLLLSLDMNLGLTCVDFRLDLTVS